MSGIEPCHSCENRNPGSWLVFWIPASAGMTILNISNVESLNLGYISFPPLCHRLTELNSDLNMGLIGQVSAKLLREGTLREES